jgi:ABC-2 type transport system permease protein
VKLPESELAHAPLLAAGNWCNPNLEFTWFTVPGLFAIIALLVGVVSRRRPGARTRARHTRPAEVSPLRTHELLLGKLAAADADRHAARSRWSR